MGDPTLLNLDTIAAGQQQMYQTSNDADSELEKATNDLLAVAMSADVALTGPQFTRAFTFVLSGSVTHNLTVPASKRIFAVENESSADQNVVRGSTSIVVGSGEIAVFKTDGTANGLKAIVSGGGATGSAGGDLTGSYPNPTIGANKVGNTKLAQMATETIKGNNTGGSHDPIDLSVSDVTTMLGAGSANGLATLDSGGKIPTSQLPASVVGAVEYQGTWNASTNSPSITNGSASSANKGFYYKVSVAGTTSVDGIADWGVGDWIISDGVSWGKIDNTEAVVSVAGKTGVVTLAAADIASGTFATARIPDVRFCPSTFMAGLQQSANQLVLSFVAPIAMVIPSGGTNSQAVSQAAATGSTTFTMKKNGSSVGTIVWSGAGTVAAFTVASTVNLAAGDVLTIVGPASPDATLADVAITIYATAAVQ